MKVEVRGMADDWLARELELQRQRKQQRQAKRSEVARRVAAFVEAHRDEHKTEPAVWLEWAAKKHVAREMAQEVNRERQRRYREGLAPGVTATHAVRQAATELRKAKAEGGDAPAALEALATALREFLTDDERQALARRLE
jgi:hypothetical protein